MTKYRGIPLAADAFVVMKDSKIMLMKDGKAGQMMTLDGKMMDGGMAMEGDKAMKTNWKAQ